MEILGDLERAFASAIYPNRVLVAIVAVCPRRGAGLRGLAASMGSRRSTPPARDHCRPAHRDRDPRPAWVVSGLATRPVEDDRRAAAGRGSDKPDAQHRASNARTAATPSPTERAPSAPPLGERSGSFSGADEFHFGNGTARLIETAPGVFIVRLEDFAVRNGPDLFVYLSPSADGYADGAIELGSLKADRGNQNYEVPVGTDVSSAGSVVIWCKQFAVLFATAPLD